MKALVSAVVAALVLGTLALLLKHAQRPQSALVLGVCALVVMVATGAALVRLRSLEAQAQKLSSTSASAFTYVVYKDATQSSYGWRARAIARLEGREVGRVWLSLDGEALLGEELTGIATFVAGTEEDASYTRDLGLCGTVTLRYEQTRAWASGWYGWVGRLRKAIYTVLKPESSEGRSLVAGVALGASSWLKANGVQETFSRAGVSHLIAVSGAHVALVMSLASAWVARLPGKGAYKTLLLLVVSGAFVLTCGASMSAVRAWCMTAAAGVGRIVGRRSYALNACALCGTYFCLVNPLAALDVGLLLSAVCVMALTIFSPLARWCCRTWMSGVRLYALPHTARVKAVAALDTCVQTFMTALICTVAAWPLSVATFGTSSVVGPFTNVAVAPLFSALVTVSVLACCVSWVPVVGAAVCWAAAALGEVVLAVVSWFAALPMAMLEAELAFPAACALMILTATLAYRLWIKPPTRVLKRVLRGVGGAGAAVAVAYLVAVVLVPAGASIELLDIGQGDAVLVREGSHAVLVDTGPEDGGVVEALWKEGVTSLDAVVITHQHEDHTGGLPSLAAYVPVDELVVAEGVTENLDTLVSDAASRMGAPFEEVLAGDAWSCGNFTFEVLWPREKVDGQDNEDSLVLLVTYEAAGKELVALLTGDAESTVLDAIAAVEPLPDIDVLKVGHHGSAVSVDAQSLAALKPEVAVISAGINNSYGHPKAACLEYLAQANAYTLCTKDVGAIYVEPTFVGVRVRAAA
jgi:competence protein ComEC